LLIARYVSNLINEHYYYYYPGQLSLAIPLWLGWYMTRCTALYQWSGSISWCLAEVYSTEISAALWARVTR